MRTITITIQVETDEHGADIERAIDSWLDLDDLDGTGLGPGLTLHGYAIEVAPPGDELAPDDHVTPEHPLAETPPLAVASYPGEVLDGFLECKGCAQPFPAGEAHQLRVKGKLFAFHRGQFCPECAARYDRGELVLPEA